MNDIKTYAIVTLVLLATALSTSVTYAQESLHNFGNIQIHQDGAIGFHGDLINDGDFDSNLGLAGFYNPTEELFVLGNNKPVFFNMEVDVPNDLNFEVSVGVTSLLDFINGRITTPREDLGINLDFTNNAIYLGESDSNHVDGYVTNQGNLEFDFPIGDDFKIRQLKVIPLNPAITTYQAAYFFEDPDTPSTLPGSFNTDLFENTLSIIDPNEYWDLNGPLPVQARLTWDEDTQVPVLADGLSSLRVVGFSNVLNRWVNLGNASFSGDETNGQITSELFEPNDFSAYTLGSVLKASSGINVYTFFSPNGDGVNDTFVIEGLATSPDNELYLYNRWGVEVFSMKNYDNSFDGTSQGRVTIAEDNKLPVGTYYYVLKLKDQKDQAGAFYLNR
ncbi:gliding motility-associated C-terminal domain-containing protein [uncultured Dokdonia sp.]|uniref:gliding motility-associated C-terminal domain-containing protein n=1 Tax=uncultured Dokdonia sp. TaxID=575653 RepID=UPI00262729A7|nr:gliding motility-associated C-terminal domain-containing protein [uncultured Dokdonia sp.]